MYSLITKKFRRPVEPMIGDNSREMDTSHETLLSVIQSNRNPFCPDSYLKFNNIVDRFDSIASTNNLFREHFQMTL